MSQVQHVSFVVGSVMLLVTFLTYVRYVRRTLPEPPPATPPRSADGPTPLMLRPAMAGMVAAQACLGLQQIFEALALEFNLASLYKVSLGVSMLAFLFALQSLEHLTRRSYASSAAGAIIVGVSIWNFFQPMEHEPGAHFWSSGGDHPSWGVAWMAFFIYWNVCIYKAIRSAFSKQAGRLLRLFGLVLLNGSVLLSFLYAFVAESYASAAELLHESRDYSALSWPWNDIVTDDKSEMMASTPVVWCILSGVQVFALPYYFRALRAGYVHDLPPVKSSRGALFLFNLAVAAFLVTWGFYALSDNFKDFSNVMVRR